MKGSWARWYPLNELNSKYGLLTLVQRDSELFLELYPIISGERKVELQFESGVAAHRYVDEGVYFKHLSDLRDKYGEGFGGLDIF